MGVQEHNISTDPKSTAMHNNMMCIDVQTSSINGLQKEFSSAGDEFAIKVRKPYTITKQRERWTEDEHNKFLEALQLHGRAWRRIEEHIGTKTAVQIRSHAQKFFSKVVRESASNGAGNVKPIEIPPPRPKRKPVHPYPRKMGNLPSNGSLTIGKLGMSSSPILTASEQDNGSPTSVLSAFGSDTMSSFLSNLPTRCTSPVTSAAGSNEQETSTEDENRMLLPGQRNATLTEQTRNHTPMELDAPLKEEEATGPCLKLFGRTVMVTDVHKPSPASGGNAVQNSKPSPTANTDRQDTTPYTGIEAPSLLHLQGALHGDLMPPGKGTWSSWSGGMPPVFYPLPSNYEDVTNPIEPRVMPLPWWAFCGNFPLPFLHQPNSGLAQFSSRSCAEASNDKVMQKECSWTGSNTASAADGGHAVSSKCTELGRGVENGDNVVKDKSSIRGFVPYKRCVVDGGQHPQGMSDDGEGQSIGLCL